MSSATTSNTTSLVFFSGLPLAVLRDEVMKFAGYVMRPGGYFSRLIAKDRLNRFEIKIKGTIVNIALNKWIHSTMQFEKTEVIQYKGHWGNGKASPFMTLYKTTDPGYLLWVTHDENGEAFEEELGNNETLWVFKWWFKISPDEGYRIRATHFVA